jgi:trans-4-hydroxy-L-proline dehydratase
MPAPFLSLLIDDCIAKGRRLQRRRRAVQHDLHHAGRHRDAHRQPVGHRAPRVRPGRMTMAGAARGARAADFADTSRCASCCGNARPSYGNDDEAADASSRGGLRAVHDGIVDGRPNTRGGEHHVNYLSTTCHVYFGSRWARRPTAAGRAPGVRRHLAGAGHRHARADRGASGRPRGLDHARTGGTLLNLKFAPRCSRATRGSTAHRPRAQRTSRSTATTCSSTSSRPTRCARRRRTPRSTATSSCAWPGTATTSAT